MRVGRKRHQRRKAAVWEGRKVSEFTPLPASLTGAQGHAGRAPGRDKIQRRDMARTAGDNWDAGRPPRTLSRPSWDSARSFPAQVRAPRQHKLCARPGYPWWCLSLPGPQPRPQIKERRLPLLTHENPSGCSACGFLSSFPQISCFPPTLYHFLTWDPWNQVPQRPHFTPSTTTRQALASPTPNTPGFPGSDQAGVGNFSGGNFLPEAPFRFLLPGALGVMGAEP